VLLDLGQCFNVCIWRILIDVVVLFFYIFSDKIWKIVDDVLYGEFDFGRDHRL
jgi:hypothetical protein